MKRATVFALAAAAALVVAGCGDDSGDGDTSSDSAGATTTAVETTETTDGAASDMTLEATVGPEATIELMDSEGQPVESLPAGTYTINVDDKADNHNFHLTGAGGIDETTTVEEIATDTWTVELVAGEYTYVCDPHAQNMVGNFTVT